MRLKNDNLDFFLGFSLPFCFCFSLLANDAGIVALLLATLLSFVILDDDNDLSPRFSFWRLGDDSLLDCGDDVSLPPLFDFI